ncbi:hypothetical protein LTSEWAN_6380 [Salmonella enterica subsp. enterica serovar Wandsworth str. A4-580]|uniref:Uncharacterized protein n=1 Tax=Salmonella enterica subsp. enterica serovar Wandsworth str. A4-580 TaxID=913086 RepID=G5SKM5_SALET|nr:hypothetical protein LTSEWAN_6380 [Salmonella enterica subsp. enterica serovar Wandsworth str. A4-580]
MALIATQKKTHGASGVAIELHGLQIPTADFATAGKLYLETAKRSKPEKGAVC